MGIWTHEELSDLLSQWKAAYRAASSGKSYTIGSRSLTYRDVDEIRAQLEYLEDELEALGGGGSSVKVTYCRTVRR